MQIKTMKELKKQARGGADFYILLNFGLRSSKYINWTGTNFVIWNSIDNTDLVCSEKELDTHTHIVKAMKLGSLIKG